jgi:hypothetical protein
MPEDPKVTNSPPSASPPGSHRRRRSPVLPPEHAVASGENPKIGASGRETGQEQQQKAFEETLQQLLALRVLRSFWSSKHPEEKLDWPRFRFLGSERLKEPVEQALGGSSERLKEAMEQALGGSSERLKEAVEQALVENLLSEQEGGQAQQSMFRDIDTILARIDSGIAVERAALDALLDRLTSNAK